MTKIDYYFATISPWCYLAGSRLEDLAARHGAEICYKPVDPIALFARTNGKPLAERGEARQAYRVQELRRWAARLNLPLIEKPRHFPTNPAPASYAIIAAAKHGDVGPLVRRILTALWAEDRDIAQDEVIQTCLKETGFDPALTQSGLFLGAETYARNLEDAVAAGVFGVPFYIVTDSDERFWGQDRLDALENYLETR